MSCFNPIAKILQNQEQSHTIGPTAQCHKMQSLATQKIILSDEISNFLFHFLFHIKNKSLQVFSFRVIDIDWMICRLV